MMISFSKNTVLYFILALLAVFLVVKYLTDTNGYEYHGGREDNAFFASDGVVLVEPTVVDFKVVGNYVIGLRIPVSKLRCGNDDGYKIRISNARRYFILEATTGDARNFESLENFERAAKSLSLESGLKLLDMSKFDSISERYLRYYKKVDFSGCVEFK